MRPFWRRREREEEEIRRWERRRSQEEEWRRRRCEGSLANKKHFIVCSSVKKIKYFFENSFCSKNYKIIHAHDIIK